MVFDSVVTSRNSESESIVGDPRGEKGQPGEGASVRNWTVSSVDFERYTYMQKG